MVWDGLGWFGDGLGWLWRQGFGDKALLIKTSSAVGARDINSNKIPKPSPNHPKPVESDVLVPFMKVWRSESIG